MDECIATASCYRPVAQDLMERDDEVLLLLREAAALEVRAEVVEPTQAAALAAALQPCTHGTTTSEKAIQARRAMDGSVQGRRRRQTDGYNSESV